MESSIQNETNAERRISPSYKWVVLSMAWLATLMTFIDRLAWANVSGSASATFGLSTAALGGFVTSFYVGYVASNAIIGFVTDKVGARTSVPIAMLSLGILTFCFGNAHSVAYGMVIQCLMGLAAGVDYAGAVKLVAAWFDVKHRARAIGLIMTSMSAGVIAANTLIPRALKTLEWGGIYRWLGILTVVVAVTCALILRNDTAQGAAARTTTSVKELLPLVRNRNLWLTTIAGFGACWGSIGFIFWANALMQRGLGLSIVESGRVSTIFGIVSLIGAPLIGVLSDVIGRPRKWLTAFVLLCIGVGLCAFGHLKVLGQLEVVAAILGLMTFGWGALIAAIITEIVGVRLAASAIGISNAIFQIGAVLVPLAVGVVFQSTRSFNLAFLTLATGPLLGGAAMLMVKEASESGGKQEMYRI
ncbi:MFS transporter [Burkholderia cenocepacia]|uniref:MFS transporter n=1 Tax=Burkholderia cenocepacia TaxID=95486 RepID=UPI001B92511F|nr:MFS transporter [Burkholderia cenocepacia]MBR8030145.1 MFS transporter [Burkholderia cenocepacia]MBR8174023.1 MFS transporter [Burkholderia cenocepacia]